MVETVLAKPEQREGMTEGEIMAAIVSEFSLKSYPTVIVKKTLEVLLAEGTIRATLILAETYYTLSEDRKNQLRLVISEFNRVQSVAFGQLTASVREEYGPLSDEQKGRMRSVFYRVLGRLFGLHGAQLAQAMCQRITAEARYPIPEDLTEVVSSSIPPNEEKEFAEAERKAIEGTLLKPSEDMSRLLFSVSLSYYLIQILNLDPECRRIQKADLSKIVLYVDTSVLIYVLTAAPDLKKAVDSLLKITSQLGIGLRITERTKKEFLNNLDEVMHHVSSAGSLPPEAAMKVSEVLRQGFYRDYLAARRDNPSLSWEGYESRMRRFDLVVRNLYSIDTAALDEAPVLADSSFQEVFDAVIDAQPSKSNAVAEHDAFHIVLVRQERMRNPGGMLGPSYWFLTIDQTLGMAETEFVGRDIIPSAVTAEDWLKMIWPILPVETASKEAPEIFSTVMSSSMTPGAWTVSWQDVMLVQGPWLDDRDLTTQDIKEVLGSTYTKSFLRKERELLPVEKRPADTSEQRKRIYEAIRPQFEEKRRSRELEDRVQQLQKERQNLVDLLFKSMALGAGLLLVWVDYLAGSLLIAYGVSIELLVLPELIVILTIFSSTVRRRYLWQAMALALLSVSVPLVFQIATKTPISWEVVSGLTGIAALILAVWDHLQRRSP